MSWWVHAQEGENFLVLCGGERDTWRTSGEFVCWEVSEAKLDPAIQDSRVPGAVKGMGTE